MNLCHSLEINRFNPPYICACPKPGPGFLTTYSLRLDVFVRSVDIGEKLIITFRLSCHANIPSTFNNILAISWDQYWWRKCKYPLKTTNRTHNLRK